MKSLVWEQVERYLLIVHNQQNPSAEDFDDFLAYCLGFGVPAGVVVYSAGGALTALQRKRLRDVLASRAEIPVSASAARTAMMTNSRTARLAVTAMNLFFNNSMRAFSPEELREALSFVKAPEPLQLLIQQGLEGLLRSMRLPSPW